MASSLPLFFSVFEHSGDVLAASVAREVRRREPDRRMYGFGGPLMQRAGVTLLEDTIDHAVMLGGAAGQAMVHRRRLGRLRQWLADHPLSALVATDSPAANWSVCRTVRRSQPDARVVHLVAPQLWAWGAWRIGKLRRLTDCVLCLLPFEVDWLESRGVPAMFVGHPLFHSDDLPVDEGVDDSSGEHGPLRRSDEDGPRLALLPGSRTGEVSANWPTMFKAYLQLKDEHPDLLACVAASDARRAALLEKMLPGGVLPQGMKMLTGNASAVLDWADAALVVSGTATLHAASRHTPMVVVYRINRASWHLLGRWLVRTRTFSLPNLLGDWLKLGRVVPEFVPHHGAVDPIVGALRPLLHDSEPRRRQLAAFQAIADRFTPHRFAESCADALLRVIDEPPGHQKRANRSGRA